jgi:hypothetical protein
MDSAKDTFSQEETQYTESLRFSALFCIRFCVLDLVQTGARLNLCSMFVPYHHVSFANNAESLDFLFCGYNL